MATPILSRSIFIKCKTKPSQVKVAATVQSVRCLHLEQVVDLSRYPLLSPSSSRSVHLSIVGLVLCE